MNNESLRNPEIGDNIYAEAMVEAEVALVRRRMAEQPRVSSLYCESCDEEIPEPRRIAVVGCRYCIDCATEAERSGPVIRGMTVRAED